MENGLAVVAGLHPGDNGGDSLSDLSEHGLTSNAVKGIGEIQ